MSRQKFIMLGMFIGACVGGYIPSLWGAGAFTMSSLFISGLGGALGIWIAFKATE